jgi:oligogalacturonide lyase
MKRLALAATLAALAATSALPAHATLGQRYPSERKMVTDKVTGRKLILLTNGTVSDAKEYQTDQQWAFDGKHIIFRSGGRASGEGGQIFSIDEQTGDIVQLTEGKGVGISSIMVSRLANRVYYTRRADDGRLSLMSLELTPFLNDAMAGKLTGKPYEKLVAMLPEGFILSGGFTIDADGKTAYFGFRDTAPPPRTAPLAPGQKPPVIEGPGGVLAMDLATGATRQVVHTDFTVGHLQANPFKPGEILYCHETGGDADYRMWIVNADGSGNRPVYKENPDDWVTHEQFADADHVIFNMMGHTPKLQQHPSGIFVISLRDGMMENLGQVPLATPEPVTTPRTGPNSFWHNGVTYDGRFAAGDDFDGNLWLINRMTGERTRLSAGHYMKPDHIHPSFSADGSRILIQSGSLTQGQRLSLIIVPVDDLTAKK